MIDRVSDLISAFLSSCQHLPRVDDDLSIGAIELEVKAHLLTHGMEPEDYEPVIGNLSQFIRSALMQTAQT